MTYKEEDEVMGIETTTNEVPSGPATNIEAASPWLAELTMLLKEYVYMTKAGDQFYIKVGKTTLSSFTLRQMPGCCVIGVSTGAQVHTKYRGKGVGTICNKMRMAIAKHQKYSALICTDVLTNEHQRKILAKNGWKDAFTLTNKKTNNNVALSYIVLEEEKPTLKKSPKTILERVKEENLRNPLSDGAAWRLSSNSTLTRGCE